MSSDDAQDVYATLRSLIIDLACETGFYVLSILSFATSTYVLACKGFNTRAILILWITTFIMFSVSTCHLVLQWIGNLDTILEELGGPDNEIDNVAYLVNMYLPVINYSLSDAIVLWRVWIMWERNMEILIFPVLFALGSTLAAGIWTPFGGLSFDLILIYGSTLVTNITATTLIAVKAWEHRRLIKTHLSNTEWKSQVGSVLVLLIESGTLYSAMWIFFLTSWVCIIFIGNNTTLTLSEIFPAIMIQVSGIYPTAVITLAALQRTTWDMSVGRVVSQNAPHAEMRFEAREIRSGTSTTQTGYHHPTPTIDEGPHLHASEIEARDGEV